MRAAALALLGLAGVTALVVLAAFAPDRARDAVFLGLVAAAAIPIDKYFLYVPHVGGWAGLRFAAMDVFLLLAGALLLASLARRRVRPGLPAALVLPYALLLVQYAVSTAGAAHRALAGFTLAQAVHGLAVGALVAVLFERRHLGAVLAIVAALVFLHSTFAIVQAATGRPLGIGVLQGRPELLQETLATGAVRVRTSGLFDHPIVLADFLLVSLPLVAVGAGLARRRGARLAMLLALALGAGALVSTLSRGAWISGAVAAALLGVLAVRTRLLTRRALGRYALGACAAGLLAAVALGPTIYERLTRSQAGNLDVRLELNAIALSMIRAHPLAGVGPGNFIPTMHAFDPKGVERYFPASVHNLYLLEASEAGLPALLLFLAAGAGLLRWVRRRLAAGVEDPALCAVAVAIVAGLGGFAVSQLADFSYRIEPLHTILWTYVGLLVAALRRGPSPKEGT